MADDTTVTDEPTSDRQNETPETGEPVACRLTPEEARERMDWIEDELLPDLQDVTIADDHLTWTFERTDDAIAGVTRLADHEARCCPFATIEVTIPPAGPVTFHMDVPEGTGEALATQFEDVVDLQELA